MQNLTQKKLDAETINTSFSPRRIVSLYDGLDWIRERFWQEFRGQQKRHQAWLEAVTRRGRNITGCARGFLDGDAGHIVYNPHLKLSGATYFS